MKCLEDRQVGCQSLQDRSMFHTGGLQEVQEEHGATDVSSEMNSGGLVS